MKIKYSALVMGVSGKLNGSVGATNRGGAYLRNKGVVSNPNTIKQSLVRQGFGSLASQFRSLTPEQISAWNSATANFPYQDKLGDTRYLSGLGLFVQLNTNLQTIGLPILTTPPAKQSFPAIYELRFDAEIDSEGDTVVVSQGQFLDAPALGQFVMVTKATAPISQGVSYFKNQLRQISTNAVLATADYSFDVSVPYTANFGTLEIGQKVGFEVYLINTISGEASSRVQGSAVVVLNP